jgi:hypothetical protein
MLGSEADCHEFTLTAIDNENQKLTECYEQKGDAWNTIGQVLQRFKNVADFGQLRHTIREKTMQQEKIKNTPK